MRNFINDGYTADGYIAAKSGLHGEVRFKYRPMLHAERTAIQNEMTKAAPKHASRLMVDAISTYVKEWDITNSDDGGEVAIDRKHAAKLNPQLVERLYEIVAAWAASDSDPMTESNEGEDGGRSIADLLADVAEPSAEEASLKNS